MANWRINHPQSRFIIWYTVYHCLGWWKNDPKWLVAGMVYYWIYTTLVAPSLPTKHCEWYMWYRLQQSVWDSLCRASKNKNLPTSSNSVQIVTSSPNLRWKAASSARPKILSEPKKSSAQATIVLPQQDLAGCSRPQRPIHCVPLDVSCCPGIINACVRHYILSWKSHPAILIFIGCITKKSPMFGCYTMLHVSPVWLIIQEMKSAKDLAGFSPSDIPMAA